MVIQHMVLSFQMVGKKIAKSYIIYVPLMAHSSHLKLKQLSRVGKKNTFLHI